MKMTIEINDIVSVSFNGSFFTLCDKAIVLATPQSPGDFWIFKDVENGQVHYVSEPCTITLKESAK